MSLANSMNFNFDINKLGSTIDIKALTKNSLYEFISNLQKCKNKEEIENLVLNFCRFLGYEMQKGFSEELRYKETVNTTQKKLIDLQNRSLEAERQKTEMLEKQLKLAAEQVEQERYLKQSFLGKLRDYEKRGVYGNFTNNYF